jgi:hypothetical protein
VRRVPFSCFTRPYSFSTVPRASGPIFMFCAHELFFGRAEFVGSHFNPLRTRNHFRRYRGRRVPFSCFALPVSFSAVPRALGPFFMFSLSDSFSAVPSTSGPLCMFFAPEFILDGTEVVGCRFHVLRSRTHFWRYRGRRVPFSCFRFRTRFWRYRGHRVPFSCFACSDLFSAVPSGVGSRFHVLRS